MIVLIRNTDQPADRRRDFWSWCFAHGLVATEIADPIVVDLDRGTVTVQRLLPVSQPGDPDFPELRRDEFNRPLTETCVYALTTPVPDWMVTESADRLAA